MVLQKDLKQMQEKQLEKLRSTLQSTEKHQQQNKKHNREVREGGVPSLFTEGDTRKI